MKQIFAGIILLSLLNSCKNEKSTIVHASYIDSLISHFETPAAIKANETEIQFWKSRMNPEAPDIINGSKYAASLTARFHLTGDIHDLKKADSILMQLGKAYNNKEAGPYLALTRHSILQHRFKEADQYLQTARSIGLKKYDSYSTGFDVDFELGRIFSTEMNLKHIRFNNDYGYLFRQSKFMHYQGDLDSSIIYMQRAAEQAGQNKLLQQVALSNLGDLYVHAGKLEEAGNRYRQCLQMNPADLHSLMGLGWIALVHDKNDTLAEKIFQFVQTKTKSPDPAMKLILVAQQRGDDVLERKYATLFEAMATDSLYGGMYHKYLIELYTGILASPGKAEAIAKKELDNRATPQTYAWYAWCLLANNKKAAAYSVYEKHVSGKPLEGLELYWTGKLMKSMNQGYNAQAYFKEAIKNEFDLSPAVVRDLKKALEE